MLCRVTRKGWVTVKSSDKIWSTGEENGNPLHCSCLENPMDGGAWWAIVHGVAKSRKRLSDLTNFLCDVLVGSPCCPRDSQDSSTIPQFKSIYYLALSFLYGPTLTSIHDYWKSHSFDLMNLCWQSNVSAF